MVKKLQRKRILIQQKKMLTIVRFLVIFNILAIPMYVVMYLNLSFEPLQTFLAYSTASVVRMFGYSVTQDGFLLTTYTENQIRQIEMSWDSTGWKSMYALFALTIAAPISNYQRKFKFLLAGLPLLFFLNFLRVTTTILLSLRYGFQYFDVIHLFLWREGLIFAVVTIWLVWLWKERYNISKR